MALEARYRSFSTSAAGVRRPQPGQNAQSVRSSSPHSQNARCDCFVPQFGQYTWSSGTFSPHPPQLFSRVCTSGSAVVLRVCASASVAVSRVTRASSSPAPGASSVTFTLISPAFPGVYAARGGVEDAADRSPSRSSNAASSRSAMRSSIRSASTSSTVASDGVVSSPSESPATAPPRWVRRASRITSLFEASHASSRSTRSSSARKVILLIPDRYQPSLQVSSPRVRRSTDTHR